MTLSFSLSRSWRPRLEAFVGWVVSVRFAAPGRDIRKLGQSFTELQRIGKKTLRLLREILRPKPVPLQRVTIGRIEIERNGEVAYLEYSLSGDILELIHTAVPKRLRGMGLASCLAETALHWAREDKLKVDIICPSVQAYVARHPEYSDLVMH
jgi:predicted GNAT family acetyltransferase